MAKVDIWVKCDEKDYKNLWKVFNVRQKKIHCSSINDQKCKNIPKDDQDSRKCNEHGKT